MKLEFSPSIAEDRRLQGRTQDLSLREDAVRMLGAAQPRNEAPKGPRVGSREEVSPSYVRVGLGEFLGEGLCVNVCHK